MASPVPLSPDKLSVLYRQLAQQLAAGLTLAQALRAPSPAPSGDAFRLAAMAEAGRPVADIVGAAGAWLPATDRPFLIAAAGSGRLPLVLANLADRHAQIGATRRKMVFASLYPLAVFHFGALVLPLVRMIDFQRGLQWSAPGYVAGVALIILPVWGGAALLRTLVRRGHPAAHALLDLLPAVGGYRRHQALADFSFALGVLLEAGAPIGRAWREAGGIARSPRLRRAADAMVGHIELGRAPGERLTPPVFPAEYVARYRTGETTGGLETALLSLAADHQQRANDRLAAAAVLYPALLFSAVAAMVGYIVIGFVLNYVNTLNGLMAN